MSIMQLLIAAALPSIVEQVGKTARRLIHKRDEARIAALEQRSAELEARARWTS